MKMKLMKNNKEQVYFRVQLETSMLRFPLKTLRPASAVRGTFLVLSFLI
jgi:hypothetical protein